MTRRTLALTVLVVAAGLLTLPVASAKRRPSCYRGGATLIAAEGNTIIVKVKHRPGKQRTRDDAFLACWAPTGRRGEILHEEDFGDDFQEHSDFEIIAGRWIGAYELHSGGISESATSLVYDARNRKTVHRSKACDFERGDFSGIDDVAFLPDGGMAIACDQLLLFRNAKATSPQVLEPRGTSVGSLAATPGRRGFGTRLFWTVTGPNNTIVTKSLSV